MDTTAFIALGSNLGERTRNLAAALTAIAAYEDTALVAVSQAYESEPVGAGTEDHPRYANAVARIRTGLRADQLLGKLLATEEELGRPPAGERAAEGLQPRVIDLDLLLFGDEEWHSEDLVLPHPRMRGRAFVMRPLLETAPDARWPDGTPIRQADVDAAEGGAIVGALGPIPGFDEITTIPDADAVTEGGWVEFAMLSRFRPERKPDMDLLFAQTVLEDAGIPMRWDPHAPEDGYNPWGVGSTIRLYIPSGYAERAARVMAEAESAKIEWPEFEDTDEEPGGE